MKNIDPLITGFNVNDAKRVAAHLIKLLPYININKMVIVGGLAIRYWLTKSGLKYPVRPFNDLDLKVEEIDAVSPQVNKEFLIYHYHPLKKGSFYIVLVDPSLKTKVDIFDWDPPVENYTIVDFAGYRLKLQSIEDQLVKTVYDIQRISQEKKVDPEWLLKDPFKRLKPYRCVICKSTKRFKTTPMKKIYNILGYVE